MFVRIRSHPMDEINGNLYLSCLFLGLVHMMSNGFSELPIIISRLPVFYKQRDNCFHPAWAWSIPSWLPYSVVEALVWSVVVYYTVGFAPGIESTPNRTRPFPDDGFYFMGYDHSQYIWICSYISCAFLGGFHSPTSNDQAMVGVGFLAISIVICAACNFS